MRMSYRTAHSTAPWERGPDSLRASLLQIPGHKNSAMEETGDSTEGNDLHIYNFHSSTPDP